MPESTRDENVRRLGALLKDMSVAMMTTIQTRDGSLHSRPMMAQKRAFDGTLWFFSKLNSAKVDEIRSGSQVNLAFAEPSDGHYISISGMAYVVPDRIKMESLWSDIYRSWFPKGLDEQDLVLLRVDVIEAEIWDSRSGANGELLKFS